MINFGYGRKLHYKETLCDRQLYGTYDVMKRNEFRTYHVQYTAYSTTACKVIGQ